MDLAVKSIYYSVEIAKIFLFSQTNQYRNLCTGLTHVENFGLKMQGNM